MKFITNTDRIEHNTKSQKNIGYNNNTKVISDLSKQSANLPTMKKRYYRNKAEITTKLPFRKKNIVSKTHLTNLLTYPKKD